MSRNSILALLAFCGLAVAAVISRKPTAAPAPLKDAVVSAPAPQQALSPMGSTAQEPMPTQAISPMGSEAHAPMPSEAYVPAGSQAVPARK